MLVIWFTFILLLIFDTVILENIKSNYFIYNLFFPSPTPRATTAEQSAVERDGSITWASRENPVGRKWILGAP